MGRFLEQQKLDQAKFKMSSPFLSDAARRDGIYAKKSRAFCLPQDEAAQNLFPGIREEAIRFFALLGIKWHDTPGGDLPSNHLCDSQVCCVNFLFPFTSRPEALKHLLKAVRPTVSAVLPIEPTGEFLTFEWIGMENYLRERMRPRAKRTRGANFTSADAAALIEHKDGTREIVLIEWKYTESYSSTNLSLSSRGTDRTEIYSHLWIRNDFPLRKELLPEFSSLFYEPFYQLLRLQCLAHEMERANELGAERVSLLHICPATNRDFQRVTSPALVGIGSSVSEVWERLVRDQTRFDSAATENLFGRFPAQQFSDLEAWWAYLTSRYKWVLQDG